CNEDNDQNYAGTRIIQTYIERGVPFESLRNFVDKIALQSKEDMFGTSDILPISTWLLHQLKHIKDKFEYETQFVFGISRGAGGHTSTHLQEILGDDHGRLQVHVVNTSYMIKSLQHQQSVDRLNVYEKFYGGLTLICAQMVDNVPRSLGFIHNIDYFVNAYDTNALFNDSMHYEHYSIFNESMWNLPYINETLNIQITVVWDEWSCCSACCCSVALCGLYSNAKKCQEIDSYRERKGYLSVLLLDSKDSINLPNKKVSYELDKILRLSPYRENGIAVFSSLILNTPRFREHFWHDVLMDIIENQIGITNETLENSVGLFIEEQDCTGMLQKTNCTVLAECRGQTIREPPPPVEELVVVDPCSTVPMTVLPISESSASFRYEANTSYRLRLDGLDKETIESIEWKIEGKSVNDYDLSKPCDEQGIVVHTNGMDLILIEPNETQIVDVLIEASVRRRRYEIHFLVDKQQDKLFGEKRVVIENVIMATALTIVAMAVFILIHKCYHERTGKK
ncbi:hypothetical protein DICVIV_07326, partial [Dictyocaulus viviparus]